MAKSRPWIRLYTEVPDDPKVQSLTAIQFKFWINCLCLAGRNDGWLPPDEQIAWCLREQPGTISKLKRQLVDLGLIEDSPGGFTPHGWAERQYETDTSTSRVKRFRERSGKRPETQNETPMKRDETVSGNGFPSALLCSALSEDSKKEPEVKKLGSGFDTSPQLAVAGKTIPEWVDHLYGRHPKKKNLVLIVDVLVHLAENWQPRAKRAGVKTCDELFRLIDSAHAAECTSIDWTKERAKFCPSLDKWLEDEGYTANAARASPGNHGIFSDYPKFQGFERTPE